MLANGDRGPCGTPLMGPGMLVCPIMALALALAGGATSAIVAWLPAGELAAAESGCVSILPGATAACVRGSCIPGSRPAGGGGSRLRGAGQDNNCPVRKS